MVLRELRSAGGERLMLVLLVEDHGLVREGFRLLVDSMRRFDAVVESGSLTEALSFLDSTSSGAPPHVGLVLLDLGLPDSFGLEGLDRLISRCPDVPMLVVSGGNDADTIRAAFAHGARGFVPKNSSAPAFREAIETVLRGELYIPPHAADLGWPRAGSDPAESGPGAPRLTRRQQEVLVRIARGLANKEIAVELTMSPATVRVHVTAILKELGLENRTQAAISPIARRLLALGREDAT